MKALEMEMVVPMNGKLPSFFQEIFGKKVRLIALFEEGWKSNIDKTNTSPELMSLAGKIHSFQTIEDPVAFQRQLRDEWEDR